jgi:hypothetical protein
MSNDKIRQLSRGYDRDQIEENSKRKRIQDGASAFRAQWYRYAS